MIITKLCERDTTIDRSEEGIRCTVIIERACEEGVLCPIIVERAWERDTVIGHCAEGELCLEMGKGILYPAIVERACERRTTIDYPLLK